MPKITFPPSKTTGIFQLILQILMDVFSFLKMASSSSSSASQAAVGKNGHCCLVYGTELTIELLIGGTLTVSDSDAFTPPLTGGTYAAGTQLGPMRAATHNHTTKLTYSTSQGVYSYVLDIRQNCGVNACPD